MHTVNSSFLELKALNSIEILKHLNMYKYICFSTCKMQPNKIKTLYRNSLPKDSFS